MCTAYMPFRADGESIEHSQPTLSLAVFLLRKCMFVYVKYFLIYRRVYSAEMRKNSHRTHIIIQIIIRTHKFQAQGT
jgi:hypothetical protein